MDTNSKLVGKIFYSPINLENTNGNYFLRAAHVNSQIDVRNKSCNGSPYQLIRICYNIKSELPGIVDRSQLWEQI